MPEEVMKCDEPKCDFEARGRNYGEVCDQIVTHKTKSHLMIFKGSED